MAEMKMNKVPVKDRIEWIKGHKNYYERIVNFNLKNFIPRNKKVALVFEAEGEGQYMNFETMEIHIGLSGLPCDDLLEMTVMVTFAIGHEIQHFRCTRIDVQKAGVSQLVKGFARHNGKKAAKLNPAYKPIFIKDSDYDAFYEAIKFESKASPDEISHFAHTLMNILEDGRIERIRSEYYPGWNKYRIYYRSKMWFEAALTEEIPEKPKAPELLNLIVSELWQYSVFGSHSKGYFDYVPEDHEVNKMFDLMAADVYGYVMSDDHRSAFRFQESIMSKLFDLMWEAWLMSDYDKMMSEFLKSLSGMSAGTTAKKEVHGMGTGSGMGAGSGEGSDSDDAKDGDGEGEGTKVRGDGSGDGEGDSGFKTPKASGFSKGSRDIPRMSPKDIGTPMTEEELESLREELETAMAEAAAECAGEAAITETEARTTETKLKASRSTPEEVHIDESEPIVNEDLDMEEVFRKYEVCDVEPLDWFEIAERFKTLIDDFFEDQKRYSLRCRTTGSLDTPHKLIMGDISCFRKDIHDTDKGSDLCVYLLQDNSGSMGYGRMSKRYFACMSTNMAEYALKERFPLKIGAFDCVGWTHTIIEVVKNWEDCFNDSCSYNFCTKGRGGSGNRDSAAILQATKELLERPENNKLLIVLSDGAPTECSVKDVTDAVTYARGEGVKVVGIYFADDYESSEEAEEYKKMYVKDAITCAPENIADELADVLFEYTRECING